MEWTLSMLDKQSLLQGKELTDQHMNATSKILAKQFPEMPRMQNCLLVQKEILLSPAVANSMFFHCLKLDEDCYHWALSHLNNEIVYVYDSLHLGVRDELKQQLTILYGTRGIRACRVQSQRGITECGCYAIAFCVSLHFGEDPTSLLYKQREMRKHIVACMEKGCFSPFPSAPKKLLTSPHIDLTLK